MPAAANIKLWLSVQFVLARLKKAKEDLLQGKNEAPVCTLPLTLLTGEC